MSNDFADDPIDAVAEGDIIAVDRGSGARPYKVVHKDSHASGYTVTLEADNGETFQIDYASGTVVNRSLESKWESTQSPTPHQDPSAHTEHRQ